MKIKVVDKKDKSVEVPKAFQVSVSPKAIAQVILAMQSNKRQGNAHTKTRGEVSGGGKKPWRQKGTGRARAGSTRSPLWVGGGVVFGPSNLRNWHKKVNKKLNHQVLLTLVFQKIQEKKMIVVGERKFTSHKTKEFIQYLSRLPIAESSTILLVWEEDPNLYLAVRNLPYLKLTSAGNLNCLDLTNFDYLIVNQNFFNQLISRFGIKK